MFGIQTENKLFLKKVNSLNTNIFVHSFIIRRCLISWPIRVEVFSQWSCLYTRLRWIATKENGKPAGGLLKGNWRMWPTQNNWEESLEGVCNIKMDGCSSHMFTMQHRHSRVKYMFSPHVILWIWRGRVRLASCLLTLRTKRMSTKDKFHWSFCRSLDIWHPSSSFCHVNNISWPQS